MKKHFKTKLASKLSVLSLASFLIVNVVSPISLTTRAANYEDPGAGYLPAAL